MGRVRRGLSNVQFWNRAGQGPCGRSPYNSIQDGAGDFSEDISAFRLCLVAPLNSNLLLLYTTSCARSPRARINGPPPRM